MELASVSPDAEIKEPLPHCKHCDRPFKPRHDRGRPQLHCSDACRLAYRKATGSEALAAWKWRHSEAGRESRRLSKRRKKIGKVGGKPRDASFDRIAIFARDGWRCQLCGARVQDDHSTSMDSATIRLLVPVQLGGKYSLENCETACRQCNGRAAALVARSLRDSSFTLPRSLRTTTMYDAEPSQGPLRSLVNLLDRSRHFRRLRIETSLDVASDAPGQRPASVLAVARCSVAPYKYRNSASPRGLKCDFRALLLSTICI
jgi:5-methylcytosine-specific restriction endonuclease McrA